MAARLTDDFRHINDKIDNLRQSVDTLTVQLGALQQWLAVQMAQKGTDKWPDRGGKKRNNAY